MYGRSIKKAVTNVGVSAAAVEREVNRIKGINRGMSR